jgi:ATP-binding cassette subfamily B protein
MLLPLLFQVIVDVAVGQKDWSVLIVFVGAQLCLYVGQLSSQIVRTWIVLGMGTMVNLERVSRFFQQLVRLRWPFFANRMLGDIMLRIDDHKRIEKFLLGPAMELMMSWIQLFFLTLVLLRYSPLVFLLVFGAAVLWFYMRFQSVTLSHLILVMIGKRKNKRSAVFSAGRRQTQTIRISSSKLSLL